MPRAFGEFVKDTSGAIAPTYFIALFGVLAMAGVGYDYAQFASLDTELQNAADQAALAAATQLTGVTGSTANATSAASNLVTNRTIMAGDAATNRTLAVATVTYFATQAAAEAGTPTTTSDTAARFVKVTLSARTSQYALTSLIGLFTSPSINAAAVAGLNSSLCKVPPVLICNPATTQSAFDVDANIGKGLLLTFGNNGNTALTSGMLGFLDPGQTTVTKKNSATKQDYAKLVGYDAQAGNCISINQPFTQDGTTTYVTAAFNTRFDVFDNPDPIKCYQDGLCSPSDNARKDLVQKYTGGSAPTTLSKNDCVVSSSGSQGWTISEAPYRPTSAILYKDVKPKISYPDAMGYPRDLVHAYPGAVSRGRIGDGTWDIDAYWNVNYGKAYASDVTTAKNTAKPTRYEVYRWERATSKLSTTARTFNGTKSAKYADFSAAMCKPGVTPSATKPDRRILSAAVVDCSTLASGSGIKAVTPLAWMDVFLVEPALDRTDASGTNVYTTNTDVYVEVIGKTTQGSAAGGSGTQFVRRDKAYLIQ